MNRHGAWQQCGLGLLGGRQVRLRYGAAEPRQTGALREGVSHRRHGGGDLRGRPGYAGGGGAQRGVGQERCVSKMDSISSQY